MHFNLLSIKREGIELQCPSAFRCPGFSLIFLPAGRLPNQWCGRNFGVRVSPYELEKGRLSQKWEMRHHNDRGYFVTTSSLKSFVNLLDKSAMLMHHLRIIKCLLARNRRKIDAFKTLQHKFHCIHEWEMCLMVNTDVLKGWDRK